MIVIKLSVIVPVYNSSMHLRECLNSLVNQTLKQIEIIIINDASYDNSLDIIKEYQRKYPNIKVINNTTNLGQSASRNIGIESSTGDYITFLDSDDYIPLNYYETLYNEILTNNYPDIANSNIRFVNEENYEKNLNSPCFTKGRITSLTNNPDDLIFYSPSVCNKLFKRELLNDIRFLKCFMWEDIAFSYSALIKSSTILTVPRLNYFYRRDLTRGVSSKEYSINPYMSDIFKVADEIERKAKKHNKFTSFQKQIRLLQIAICLNRVESIKSWNIPYKEKLEYMKMYYELIVRKYGNPHNIDKGLLSAKTDINLISQIESISFCKI